MSIPKVILQTWKTKNLPQEMLFYTEKIKQMNPSYEYLLFDDEDCRESLKEFPKEVLECFDNLLYGAYKADLWRYAYLYLHGGVYLDIDFQELVPLNEFLKESDTFVSVSEKQGHEGIFQGFLAVEKGNIFMKLALDKCVQNIQSKRRDLHHLEITGPRCLGSVIEKDRVRLLELKDEGIYQKYLRIFNIKYKEYCQYDLNRYSPCGRWHKDFPILEQLSKEDLYKHLYTEGGLFVHPSIRVTKDLTPLLSRGDVILFCKGYFRNQPILSDKVFLTKASHPFWLSLDLKEKGVVIIPLSEATQYLHSLN